MNVYEIITNQILNRINEAKEKGEKFYWVKPWNGGAPAPMSYTTGKPYRGINRLILEPGEYVTFKGVQDYRKTQPEDSVIFVKRGSSTYPVFHYGEYELKDDEGNAILDNRGYPEKKRYLRFYQVFNIEDVKGTHSHYPAIKQEHTDTAQTKLLERYIKAYTTAESIEVDIVEDGQNCFYSPSNNRIRVPDKAGFNSIYDYYSSLLHEIVHSTSKGLYRACKGYGTDAYCREELIAQIGSQMLLAHFRITATDSQLENDIGYIDGWASKLKENVKEIANAAAQAQKAVEYFLSVAEKKNPKLIKKEEKESKEQKPNKVA